MQVHYCYPCADWTGHEKTTYSYAKGQYKACSVTLECQKCGRRVTKAIMSHSEKPSESYSSRGDSS